MCITLYNSTQSVFCFLFIIRPAYVIISRRALRIFYSLLAHMHFSHICECCLCSILHKIHICSICDSICEKKKKKFYLKTFSIYNINQHLYRKPNTCNLPKYIFFCCKCNHKARHGWFVWMYCQVMVSVNW